MDLSLLKTFMAVYRAGSLTAAARQLSLSQSTFTAQVRALEERLGQQFFRRLPRGVTPTSVADELAGEVAAPLDALTAVAERGLGRTDPFSKPLHLAGPAELTTTRVVPSLAPLVGATVVRAGRLAMMEGCLDVVPSPPGQPPARPLTRRPTRCGQPTSPARAGCPPRTPTAAGCYTRAGGTRRRPRR